MPAQTPIRTCSDLVASAPLSINVSCNVKAGDHMPTGIEVTKQALDDFRKIQEYMLLAKKENATETYAKLKDEYLTIKALLQVSGVNLTDIDKIKE